MIVWVVILTVIDLLISVELIKAKSDIAELKCEDPFRKGEFCEYTSQSGMVVPQRKKLWNGGSSDYRKRNKIKEANR